MVNHNYIVGYEGACDPITEECFVGCEDDACTTEYYYSKMQKYAPDLLKECGKDITDCEAANICFLEDHDCSLIYCNIEVDGDACENLNEESDIQDDSQTGSTSEEDIINNNIDDINI
ncbi:MAG: hypothetical protein WAV10_03895 [Minisyncoccia bacterium]